jgi:hypothetical protein
MPCSQFECQPTFQRNISPPSSMSKNPSKLPAWMQVASRVTGWTEMSDYIGRRREMEERTSVPRVRVTSQLTVSQSVYLGVEPRLGLMTRYLLTNVKVTVLSMGHTLWQEVGCVVCHSQSLSYLSVYTYIIQYTRTYQIIYLQHIQGLCQSRIPFAHRGTEWNRWALTPPPSEPIGDKNRSLAGHENGRFCWSGKETGNGVRTCWVGNRRVRERGQVSESQAWGWGWGSRRSGRKRWRHGGDWWAPGGGIFCALIRNRSVVMWGKLRQKISSLFIFLGWRSISIASLSRH